MPRKPSIKQAKAMKNLLARVATPPRAGKVFLFNRSTDPRTEILSTISYPRHVSTWDFVYLVECSGLTKIGVSARPKDRIGVLQTGNPEKVTLTLAYRVKDAVTTELFLHTKFRTLRHRREWFRLSRAQCYWVQKFLEHQMRRDLSYA